MLDYSLSVKKSIKIILMMMKLLILKLIIIHILLFIIIIWEIIKNVQDAIELFMKH